MKFHQVTYIEMVFTDVEMTICAYVVLTNSRHLTKHFFFLSELGRAVGHTYKHFI